MKKITFASAALLTMFLGTSILHAGEKPSAIARDYRNWNHAKSMVITDKSSPLAGFHHVYVNNKAIKAHKKGGTYPEGSAFIVSFYEVVEDKGTISQGKKTMVAAMVKDKKAADTGGWTYAAFDPEGKQLDVDVKKDCFECHMQVKDNDYIFSKFIE